LEQEQIDVSEPEVIPKRRLGNPLPLSFAQERLWFLDQLVPGNPFYSEGAGLRLTLPLNVAVLERSLNEIVRRHEILRTTFAVVEGRPVQVVADSMHLKLPVIDLRHLPPSEREATAVRLATEDARQVFDLAKGPMIRTTLLRLGDHDYVFLLAMHHIISDGWSLGVFCRELGTIYAAFSAGRPSPLPELRIQYADFAVWQREWLQGDVRDQQLSYWKGRLGNLPVLQLPTDGPRPAVFSYRGDCIQHVFPRRVLAGLKALMQAEEATLFMVLLAAFQLLLHRYTGQKDVVVGSPIANRNRAEIEDLIGFFVNTLVMRTDLSGNPSFRELIGRVREVALGAYAHQDLPFETLVGELHPERDLSRNPLFQVIFQVGHAPQQQSSGAGLPLLEVKRGTAKFDLRVDFWEGAQGLEAKFEYSTDLFEPATIRRMMEHFQILLESIVADPDRRIGDLRLLSAEEEHRLLVEWNRTDSAYPRQACVHELFEAEAARHPDATAVVYGDTRLTYGELNRWANRIAHRLRELGVEAETLVGLCTERSVETIAGMLGILKAGGAYVPLDAGYPRERLAFMMTDARLKMLLTQRRLLADLAGSDIAILQLDNPDEIAGYGDQNPPAGTTAANLAYVMYTSGSTGLPKGTCITHSAINRLVRDTNYVELNASDVMCQASNCSFDAATFEIWGALLNGAQLAGVSRDVTLSPPEFTTYLETHGVTVLFLTTALFNQIAREGPRAFGSLRYLLFGGESVDPRWPRLVQKVAAPQRLLHVYGPTESTTFASWHPVTDVQDNAETVPIGMPVANTRIYLLDDELRLVPTGVVGELYIGGDGLARGYLNRPDLTAEKFVPDPTSGECGSRLYRTGDLARHLPDGNIQFLGRRDNQIKIRGYRVELDEIESTLIHHEFVEQAVVVAREDQQGNKRLVAYLVTGAHAPAEGDIKRFLASKLPDYALPASFVLVDALPLNENGKVDRRSLPAPKPVEIDPIEVGARTPVEEVLVGLWREVLGADRVSVHDNLFSDLGGHSLLATQLVTRIRNSFEIEFPLQLIFERPTIAEVAEAIEEQLLAEIEDMSE
jgi:amino acid adenylation domain-containing protein